MGIPPLVFLGFQIYFVVLGFIIRCIVWRSNILKVAVSILEMLCNTCTLGIFIQPNITFVIKKFQSILTNLLKYFFTYFLDIFLEKNCWQIFYGLFKKTFWLILTDTDFFGQIFWQIFMTDFLTDFYDRYFDRFFERFLIVFLNNFCNWILKNCTDFLTDWALKQSTVAYV